MHDAYVARDLVNVDCTSRFNSYRKKEVELPNVSAWNKVRDVCRMWLKKNNGHNSTIQSQPVFMCHLYNAYKNKTGLWSHHRNHHLEFWENIAEWFTWRNFYFKELKRDWPSRTSGIKAMIRMYRIIWMMIDQYWNQQQGIIHFWKTTEPYFGKQQIQYANC